MESLLINNANQFVDALDACAMDILDYQEVIASANIDRDEIREICSWDGESGIDIILKESEDYKLSFFNILPGDSMQEAAEGRNQYFSILIGTLIIYNDDEKDSKEFKIASLSIEKNFCEISSAQIKLSNESETACCGFKLCVY